MSPNQFGPDENITRESVATMLYRHAKTAGIATTTKAGNTGTYPGEAVVSDWAVDAMARAIGMGILTGVSAGEAVFYILLSPTG